MRLSKVVLTKGDRSAILQGLVHVAPAELYVSLQRDLEWASENRFRVFYEGFVKDEDDMPLTDNEEQIREFFELLFRLYDTYAAALGDSDQMETLTYPYDAINADISFSEYMRMLDDRNYKCWFLLWIFAHFPKMKVVRKILLSILNSMIYGTEKDIFSKVVIWFFFRKVTPVLIGHRNEVAVATVKTLAPDRNILLHYGEKHIPGLVSLFKEDGWTVKETAYLEFAVDRGLCPDFLFASRTFFANL